MLQPAEGHTRGDQEAKARLPQYIITKPAQEDHDSQLQDQAALRGELQDHQARVQLGPRGSASVPGEKETDSPVTGCQEDSISTNLILRNQVSEG